MTKKITQCRACGSRALTPAFSLRPTTEKKWFRKEISSQYVLCDPSRDARACGLLQSATAGLVVDEDAPSARYRANREHLQKVATTCLELLSGRDCAALDIGCNDGTLLSHYPRWVERAGVDPSSEIDEIGAWARTVKAPFLSPDIDNAFEPGSFDIITAVSVLERMDDPRPMIAKVKSLLAEDGVFALETLYAPVTLTRNALDTLQAGVTALYSLSVLEWLLRDAGLKAFKGVLTEKNGGSIRLYITHADVDCHDFDPWYERLARIWDEENALAMRALQPYQSFDRRAEAIRRRFSEMLVDIAERGETVHLLGAEGPSRALIEWAGPASNVVTAVVDTAASRREVSWGPQAPRIISESESRAAEPNYLLAPARHKREMMERYRDVILRGAKLIFATPSPHVVSSANFASEYGGALADGDGAGGVETLRSILSTLGGPRLVAEQEKPLRAGAGS
ncbi:MAG: class I SAM-dependent methyltransferase [Pseudomonadota bacterium]